MWDTAKAVIRGQLISYTAARKKSITKKTERFKRELINLERSHKQSLKLEKTKRSQNQSQSYTNRTYLKTFILYQTALSRKHTENTIKCTRNTAGQLKYDIQSIKSSFLDFYKQLYASENPSITDIHRFLERVSLPSISDDQKQQLSAPFTSEEVLQAIKSMPSGKTPGLDGYSLNF